MIIPFAAWDNWIDALARQWLGFSTGLLLSGTIFAVVFAYVVRFLAVSIGSIESSLSRVSESMDMAARTLGYPAHKVLTKFHLPLIKGGILTAGMVVFVDSMKELPATLILRPFNFETLAVLAAAAESSTTPSPIHEPGPQAAALPLALTWKAFPGGAAPGQDGRQGG